jgi:CRISPR-associated protein Csd2
MSELKNKIDFVALVSVTRANPNGDPLSGNRPRVTFDGSGEISDVCIKRKIRNRLQDMGENIFVQMNERCDDGCQSLKERAEKTMKAKGEDKEQYAKEACEKFIDVRTFGQVFAYGKGKKGEGVSVGVRGPVTIHQAISCSPIDVTSMKITKSVRGDTSSNKEDTMGDKHFVEYGLYKIKGAINVQLAEKTGFSEEDAEKVKEALRTLFVNDASAARPEGSMEIAKVYWWKHNNKIGQYSSAKVHNSVKVLLKDGVIIPKSIEDYQVVVEELPGLEPEIIDGM